MSTQPGTSTLTDYDTVMAQVGAQQAFQQDVVTLAQSLRQGVAGVSIHPVGNGFIVSAGTETFIAKKPQEVGLLIKTLYSGDLSNQGILQRLRRLTGSL